LVTDKNESRTTSPEIEMEGQNEVNLMAYEVGLMAIKEESLDSNSTKDQKQPEGLYVNEEEAFYMKEVMMG
jgi:hypothetical protein